MFESYLPFNGTLGATKAGSATGVLSTAVLCPGDAFEVFSEYQPVVTFGRLSPGSMAAWKADEGRWVFTYDLPVPVRLGGDGWGDACAAAEVSAGNSTIILHGDTTCSRGAGWWCDALGIFCYTPDLGVSDASVATFGAKGAFGVDLRADGVPSAWNESLATAVYGSAGIFVAANSSYFNDACGASPFATAVVDASASAFVAAFGRGDPGSFCSGAMTAAGLVFTAAHCVTDGFAVSAAVDVHLGSTDLSSGAYFAVAKAVYPAAFSSAAKGRDVAIVQVDYDAEYGYPFFGLSVTETADTVYGWGLANVASKYTVSAMKTMPMQATQSCASNATDRICLLGIGTTCAGDSGGPCVGCATPQALGGFRFVTTPAGLPAASTWRAVGI